MKSRTGLRRRDRGGDLLFQVTASMPITYDEVPPVASERLLAYLLGAIDPPAIPMMEPLGGLPTATIELPQQSLIASATCCSGTLFQRQMLMLSAARHEDVVLIRHGMHPETLDPVTVDLALPAPGKATLLAGLMFYRRRDELRLIPQRDGCCVRITPNGLVVESVSPFGSQDERSAGLTLAAAEIVRLTRTRP